MDPITSLTTADGEFTLHDLSITVEHVGAQCTCAKKVGDRIMLKGGKLSMPDGQNFCLYALQAVIPLLPAKQRSGHPADWMETDTVCTCPDPACGLLMRITRDGLRTLRHDDVSAQPWEKIKARALQDVGNSPLTD